MRLKIPKLQNCAQCGVQFTALFSKRIFCTKRCLKKRDDARYYQRHTVKVKANTAAYKQKHKDIYLQYYKKYRNNPENISKMRPQKKKWASKNKDYCAANLAKYRATKKLCAPKWLTLDQLKAIQKFYKEANILTKTTGISHHVDHIVPLQGKHVCGLHVPWNLQILTALENCKKSNKYG